MGDNTKIILLEKQLADTLNGSELPILVKKMVLEKFLINISEVAERVLQEEALAEKAEQAESEEKENGIRITDLG